MESIIISSTHQLGPSQTATVNPYIPDKTKCFLFSNRLRGFPWACLHIPQGTFLTTFTILNSRDIFYLRGRRCLRVHCASWRPFNSSRTLLQGTDLLRHCRKEKALRRPNTLDRRSISLVCKSKPATTPNFLSASALQILTQQRRRKFLRVTPFHQRLQWLLPSWILGRLQSLSTPKEM